MKQQELQIAANIASTLDVPTWMEVQPIQLWVLDTIALVKTQKRHQDQCHHYIIYHFHLFVVINDIEYKKEGGKYWNRVKRMNYYIIAKRNNK